LGGVVAEQGDRDEQSSAHEAGAGTKPPRSLATRASGSPIAGGKAYRARAGSTPRRDSVRRGTVRPRPDVGPVPIVLGTWTVPALRHRERERATVGLRLPRRISDRWLSVRANRATSWRRLRRVWSRSFSLADVPAPTPVCLRV